MDLRDFLSRVLPPGIGAYYGSATSQGGGFTQRKFDSLESLQRYIEAQAMQRKDVYFAVGAFNGARQIDKVTGKQALYADIDVGPDKPHGDKATALRVFHTWAKAHFKLPSIIVLSGSGFHVYWTLTRTLTRQEWQVLSDALRQHMEGTGFPVLAKDASIITDAARILRPPGTTNYKNPAAPVSVRVLRADPNDFNPEDLASILGMSARQPRAALFGAGDDDLSGGLEQRSVPKPAAKLFTECEVFKEMLATGGANAPGLSWMQQLHVLAYTDDGETYIHNISNKHSDYSHDETLRKWNQRVARRESDSPVGPTSCATFAKFHPELCARCPNNGRVKSPLVLTFMRSVTGLPFPYEQDDKGVYFQADDKDDDGNIVRVRVSVVPFKVQDFALYQSPDSSLIQFTADFKTHTSTAILDYPELIEKRAAIAALSLYHILITDKQFAAFRDFLMSWAMQMQAAKLAQPVISHLGWVTAGGRRGFGMGDRVFWSDGTESTNASRSKHLMSMYTPQGEAQPWRDVAHAICNRGRFALDAIVLSAFASPLMLWTPTAGAILSFVSRESGSGKSTALQCAQAVWGDPVRGMNALDDTSASILHKIGYTKNLPAYWDEVRARQQAARFVTMIYSLSQGKERSRLKATIALQDSGTWNTMLIVASNESIADHTVSVVQDSESGRVRLFEVTVPVIDSASNDKQLYDKTNELRTNFGVVGTEYARYLATNEAKIKQAVTAMVTHIQTVEKTSQTDRFWVSAIAALYVAAVVAKQQKLLDVDLPGFLTWLREQLNIQRAAVRTNYATIAERGVDLLAAYCNEFRDQLLLCDHLTGQGRRDIGTLHSQPQRGAILGMIALKDQKVRLGLDEFTKWLYTIRAESPSQIIAQMEADGAKQLRGKIGGVANSLDIRVKCLDVPLQPEDMEQVAQAVEPL